MKKAVVCAFGALLLTVSLSLPALPQTRNSINGFVFGEGRRPLADVHVELLNDLGATLSRTKTSGSGVFTFRGLSDGIFYVKVMPYGIDYHPEQQRVALVAISARPGSGSITEQVDFYLRPKVSRSGPLAAPAVVFAQDVPEDAKKLYDEAVVLLTEKKADEAYAKLRSAIEAFPRYYMALELLGTEYVGRSHYAPAEVLLTQAVEINPEGFPSRFSLGLAQFRLNRINDSVASFKRSIELQSDSVSGHLWLGIALHTSGDLGGAEKALRRANKLSNGESAEVHWQLARVYKDQGKFSDSADELEEVLKIKPDSPEAASIRETVKLLRQKARQGS